MDTSIIITAIFGIIIGAIIGAFVGLIVPLFKKWNITRNSKQKIEKQEYSYNVDGKAYNLKAAINGASPFTQEDKPTIDAQEETLRENLVTMAGDSTPAVKPKKKPKHKYLCRI